MAEVFPTSLKHRTTPNLRLGIKSSCGDLKSIIAALYIIFKSTKTPENITYSKEKVLENGSTGIELTEELASTISTKFPNIVNVIDKVNSTPLFTRQCEPLQVAIELFFNLGRLKFTDYGHSERTGKNRYKKTLMFSDKMIVIDAYLSAFNPTERDAFLSLWLEEKHDHESSIENGFKQILSTFTIDCCYKIKRGEGNELIFNLENIYEELANNNDVLFKENGQETVGPTRVLCSYVKEHMSYDIACHNEKFIAKDGRGEYLKMHYGLISNTLDLINRELPFNDVKNICNNTIKIDTEVQKNYFIPYLTALRTKPFLLLAGISGTGKSRIVREFAFKSCPKCLQDKAGTTPGNYCMIEVKPNWHDSTELLGYYSRLGKAGYQFTKFVKFLVKAKMFPNVPFFVCLDEMNLAPVEQYFAEILSILETRKHPKNVETGEVDMATVKTEPIIDAQYFRELAEMPNVKNVQTGEPFSSNLTDRDIYLKLFGMDTESDIDTEVGKRTDLTTEGLELPNNVVIIGTVNMDDTTHQFSRKVIDRAMTIEMNGGNLRNMFGGSKNMEYLPESEQKKWQNAFTRRYVSADEVLDAHPDVAEKLMEKLPTKLEEINLALKGTPFMVSYRVLNELTIMVGVMLDEGMGLDEAVAASVNNILLMKILPRVEGDAEMFAMSREYKAKAGVSYDNRLEWLKDIAPDIKESSAEVASENDDTEEKTGTVKECQQTAKEKIQEMIDRLNNQEFTRFWP